MDDPMISTYEVVDRSVLVELLKMSSNYQMVVGDQDRGHAIWQLLADIEAGRGGILTRERWEQE